MIKQTKNFQRKCEWPIPETGAASLGNRVSGQNDQLGGDWGGTPSARHFRRKSDGGFFRGNGPLPRQPLKDLQRGTGQNSEHQVAHDFGRATNTDEKRTKVVFELGVDPLNRTALFETLRGSRVHGDFLAATRIGIDDGDMSELSAKGMDFFGIVSGVHEVVAIVNQFLSLLSQGDRPLGVTCLCQHGRQVEGGGSQDGADGNVPVGNVQMEFVANPRFGEALGVALATVVAERRQIGEIFGQGSLRLNLQPAELFGFKRLVFGGTASLPGNFCCENGFGRRLFAGGDRGGVTADVSHQGGAQVFCDHGGMNFFRQMKAGEGGEGTGEGGFRGNQADGFPAAEPSQGRTIFEIIQEGSRGGEIPDGFGNERLGQRQATRLPSGGQVFGFTSNERPLKGGHETLRMAEADDLDEALLLVGKRPDLLFQHGEELALNDEGGGDELVHKKTPKRFLTIVSL